MSECIFCKITKNEIPSEKIFEDDKVIAFKDISPCAPVHILIIPKEHIDSVNELNDDNKNVIGHIFMVAKNIANNLGISENGYRIVNNCGKDGGQTVNHLHFHLVGGRNLNWPPG